MEKLGVENVEEKRPTFQNELSNLINKYSQENGSNTPDWILAEYMVNCLYAFNNASCRRSTWYSVKEGDDIGHIDLK